MIAAMVCALGGCQQKMADQPSFKPLESGDFFPDGRAARPVLAGTVARGHLRLDRAFFTGRIAPAAETTSPAAVLPSDSDNTGESTTSASPRENPAASRDVLVPAATIVPPEFRDDAAFVGDFPMPVTEPMIRHGYNRYMIYCVVCHDPLGTGHGRIVERGYTPPPSLHLDRLRNAPAGKLFAVITEGYGSMPSYANQIETADRWAIVAYVRALQLSQHFPEDRLSPEMRKELAASKDYPVEANQ